ncbi:MAG: GNAT family N-acetyltransferase [Pseudodesulfovibrio sp.]
MTITTELLRGQAIRPHLADVAGLRIAIFREYPYLYRGAPDYEQRYLSVYADSPDALAILARDGGALAGAVTAIPLRDEAEALAAPVRAALGSLDAVYYVGELLFLPPYRGLGLGSELLARVEEQAGAMGRFAHLTCATVIRPDDHPERPDGFIPIDRFLARAGFKRMDGVVAAFDWPELDGVSVPHGMQYWIKPLV